MGATIRSIGWGGATGGEPGARVQKGTALLSDGTQVAMIYDRNQVGVAGDGGDNSGLPKIYIYTAAANNASASWVLRASWTAQTYGDWVPAGSMTVDSQDNLHVCWTTTQRGVDYRKLTRSGSTWTVGGTENLVNFNQTTGQELSRIDIDVIGAGASETVAVAFMRKQGSTTYLCLYTRNTSGSAWIASSERQLINGGTWNAGSQDISICGNRYPVQGGAYFAVITFNHAYSQQDYGSRCWGFLINSSTFARVTGGSNDNIKTLITNGFASGYNNGARNWKVFNTAQNEFVVAGQLSSRASQGWQVMAAKFSATVVNTTTINLVTIAESSIIEISEPAIDQMNDNGMFVDFLYWDNTITYVGTGITYTYALVVSIQGSAIQNRYTTRWNAGYRLNGVSAAAVSVGTPANYSAFQPGWIGYTANSSARAFAVEQRSKFYPPPPISATPSGTTSTSTPSLSANYRYNETHPQYRVRMEFQVAEYGSNFTSGLRTVTQGIEEVVEPKDTNSPTYKIVTASALLPVHEELSQGAWQVRARSIDTTNTPSAWSGPSSFTVSHPPRATSLNPSSGQTIGYTPGLLIKFSWIFSDSYMRDYQTAYELQVVNTDTQATVYNSGKVTSGSSYDEAEIPALVSGASLAWRVRPYDKDDVAGVWSSWATFNIQSPPEPVILSPGSTVTTAIPQINWNPGITGGSVQQQYEITVMQGRNTLYRSGIIRSSTTSHNLPVGILENSSTYTLILKVVSSMGLQGFAHLTFDTAWVNPPTVSTGVQIDTLPYSDYGFVWVTVDTSGLDTDVSQVNLYRRTANDSAWILIHEWSVSSTILGYKDFTIAPGVTYEYAVTQIVDRWSERAESLKVAYWSIQQRIDAGYWIIRQYGGMYIEGLPLYNVTGDTFTDEYEQETYTLIGRGRHTDVGDRLGYQGSLSVQLRPKYLSGGISHNYARNSAQRIVDNNAFMLPRYWYPWNSTPGTITDLTSIIEATQDIDPAFTGRSYGITCANLPSGLDIGIQFEMPAPEAMRVSQQFTASIWYNWKATNPGTFRLYADAADNSNETVGISSGMIVGPEIIETSGSWNRVRAVFTSASSATKIRIHIRVRVSTATSNPRFYAQGVQLNEGAVALSYIEGGMIEGVWVGAPDDSASYGDGYYSARKQRLAIEEIKANRETVYLRNPFGDLTKVAVGNIQVTRIPGTGTLELTDITIPYYEEAE